MVAVLKLVLLMNVLHDINSSALEILVKTLVKLEYYPEHGTKDHRTVFPLFSAPKQVVNRNYISDHSTGKELHFMSAFSITYLLLAAILL